MIRNKTPIETHSPRASAEKGELVTSGADPALVYLASLAPTGRRTMRGTLAKVAEMLGTTPEATPWAKLEYEHVQAIRTKLAETLAPATHATAEGREAIR